MVHYYLYNKRLYYNLWSQAHRYQHHKYRWCSYYAC